MNNQFVFIPIRNGKIKGTIMDSESIARGNRFGSDTKNAFYSSLNEIQHTERNFVR